MPTVKEKTVENLGRWYREILNDKEQGHETHELVEQELEAIDKTTLPGKFKY